MLETPLHNWHLAQGGRMVDFAGWHMPVQYTSINAEHLAVRGSAGLFDIAHMGRLYFSGPEALQLIDHLVTIDVTALKPGQIKYALITNEQGGILDDVLVYRFAENYMLVVNASNREKILTWIEEQGARFEASMEDRTQSHFMLAIQGPHAVEITKKLFSEEVVALRYYRSLTTNFQGSEALISRTGYTGEDGFEIIVPNEQSEELWKTLCNEGEAYQLQPCGLGCRDTLRLEAAMPLYGHELSEQIDPFTAGLGFAVHLDAGSFVGKPALQLIQGEPKRPRRVGIVLDGKRIAREHAEIYEGADRIGEVTSGTFSPTLEQSIAMAYLHPAHSQIGTKVEVDIRGKRQTAQVVKLPFYRRST